MRKYFDRRNRFFEIFDENTGFYIRSGILDNEGKDTEIDPFKRNVPSLIDIGIMNYCRNRTNGTCTVDCYQGGNQRFGPNMSFENYKKIIDECKSFVFQVALGGLGDPNHHENFEEIMKYTRENGIVPNYTTSGFDLSAREADITKEYAGAVAVSFYKHNQTFAAVHRFVMRKIKTNIHFVLSNSSIEKAIDLLKNPGYYEEVINAVIFLLYKPIGLGKKESCLSIDNDKLRKFFDIVDNWNGKFKIGFDSCTIPGILNFTSKIRRESIDACEAGRFSMYISPDMIAVPCSFDSERKYGVGLYEKGFTVEEAWNSIEFATFRKKLKNSCLSCGDRKDCYGGCPIVNEITLCKREERKAA